MSNKEILEKAIQKAIDGGWKKWNRTGYTVVLSSQAFQIAESLIFNHDFAKALWEDIPFVHLTVKTDASKLVGYEGALTTWQYHLQQMVIAEDPIKYLGEHLDG